MKRLTIEEMQTIAAERGGRCLSSSYVNGSTSLEWECRQGHRWWARPADVKRLRWCGICARQQPRRLPLTIDDMQTRAGKLGGRCLSEAYAGTHTALEWECAVGHRWFARPVKITMGVWCRVCAVQGQRYQLTEIQRAAQERGGKCLSTTYANVNTPLDFECAVGHRWRAAYGNVRNGTWCAQCAHQSRRLTIGEMQTLAAERGGRCLSTDYRNMRIKLTWQCHRGHIWEASPFNVKSGGRWCPICARLRITKNPVLRLKWDFEGRE